MENDCLAEETGCPGLPDCCLLLSDSSAFGIHERSRSSSHSKKDLQGVQKLNRGSSQWKVEGAATPGLSAIGFFSKQGEGRGRESVKLLLSVPHLVTKLNLAGQNLLLYKMPFTVTVSSDVHPSVLNLEGGWVIHSSENKKTNKPLSYFRKGFRSQKQGFTQISSHKAHQDILIHSEPYFTVSH